MCGKYDRQKYKQIIINIDTKKILDDIKNQENISSYNDVLNLLIKDFYASYYKAS